MAIGLALLYPDPEKGGRGIKGKASETDGFSQSRLKAARTIVRHSLHLAEQVHEGSTKFDDALRQVEEARQIAAGATLAGAC